MSPGYAHCNTESHQCGTKNEKWQQDCDPLREDGSLALDEYLEQSRPTRCEGVDRDRYGRVVANCFRQGGEGSNQWLVLSGNAVDWVRYSHGAYASDQEAAKAQRRGIWQGHFELPCEARAARSKRPTHC